MTNQSIIKKLKSLLQKEKDSGKLENLAAALLGRLLGITIAVAKSGFQHGGDAGPAGRQGRRLRIECKKYSDTTALSDRELLGEIDHALSRDRALEAWVLVATREVSEQLEQALHQKGESIGVPVIVLDWKPVELPSLAAICAFAPDLVERIFSHEAGEFARLLQPISAEAIENLKRELQAWSLGFECLRTKSLEKLDKIWLLPRESNAALGQNAAGGAERKKIRRSAVHDALDKWWEGPAINDAPAAVVGLDGVGKTWATLHWLVELRETLPIVLVVPSSSVAGLSSISETAIKRFLADCLYVLTGVRDANHWLLRLDNLLKRPVDEGPVLTVFFDGLNQEPSTPWLSILKVLQGDHFASRVRVIISTRTLHYENKLNKLRGLIEPTVLVPVDLYDTDSGGELDQMLELEGLTQEDLHPDLIELARTPRLFKLVVKFRDQLVQADQLTVHRLLWEYGRDTLGTRAGRSFSEYDWREWLKDVAFRYREGIYQFSMKTLSQTVSRPDLSEKEVYARLSDIIDGQFASFGPSGDLQLKPTVVSHALGAALLDQLDAISSPTFDSINTELTQWLDPIDGLDQRSEILRAAVSIIVERETPSSPLAGVLVTAWLQTQNITDSHRIELCQLATNLVEALLDAVEHSEARTHASARLWAVNALRSIERPNSNAFAIIVKRACQWLSIISRDVLPSEHVGKEYDKYRSEHFMKRIGMDSSDQIQVLGLDLHLVDWDSGSLSLIIPLIFEGFPLAEAMPAFEAAAINRAVGRKEEIWDRLKWLCLLNDVDPAETTTALRLLSKKVKTLKPEMGINSLLPSRVAALLLWLTGEEADETLAATINPDLDNFLSYDDDYLPRPGQSLFPLERRHAKAALNDTEIPLLRRIQRTAELWFDPNFNPPATFVKEVREYSTQIEVDKLDRHNSNTIEDYNFEVLEPALARCAPQLLSDLIRIKLKSLHTGPPESRYWSAISVTDHFLLFNEAARKAGRELRLSSHETTEKKEAYAATQLLILELFQQPALVQVDTIIQCGLKYLFNDLGEVLGQLTPRDVDILVTRFGTGSNSQRHDLLLLLSNDRIVFSDFAWFWLMSVAFGEDNDLRPLAYRALAISDASRFGNELFTHSWTWSGSENPWINHFGSGALIEATADLPFDQIAPRLAPWRLLEAARLRGGVVSEVHLAANIFGRVLMDDQLEVPDPGSNLSIDRTRKESGSFTVSVTPHQSENDPEDLKAAFQTQMDTEKRLKAHERAVDTAVTRIREAREAGASLYLINVDVDDLEMVLLHAPDLVNDWLDGASELTINFKRRVRLAEAPYIALCEALLKHDAARGVIVWQNLRQALSTHFNGSANIEEMLHIAFRAPDSPPVNRLRGKTVELDQCCTDEDLLNLAIAGSFNGKTGWLSTIIEEDKSSSLVWRRKRGTVLEGFTSYNSLPIKNAWPDGQIKTGHSELQRKSARFRYKEACSHHWWKVFLASTEIEEAYAAWTLFLRSADRRAWVWIEGDMSAAQDSSELFRLKVSHFRLNLSKLKRAMEKNEEKLDKHFLGRKVASGVGPWKNDRD